MREFKHLFSWSVSLSIISVPSTIMHKLKQIGRWLATRLFHGVGILCVCVCYFACCIFRPPVRSNGRTYKMLVMFLFFFQRVISEIPRPITVKLCHMIANWSYFIIQLPKFGGALPQKIWGPKTCKISVHFTQLPILIANISGTA